MKLLPFTQLLESNGDTLVHSSLHGKTGFISAAAVVHVRGIFTEGGLLALHSRRTLIHEKPRSGTRGKQKNTRLIKIFSHLGRDTGISCPSFAAEQMSARVQSSFVIILCMRQLDNTGPPVSKGAVSLFAHGDETGLANVMCNGICFYICGGTTRFLPLYHASSSLFTIATRQLYWENYCPRMDCTRFIVMIDSGASIGGSRAKDFCGDSEKFSKLSQIFVHAIVLIRGRAGAEGGALISYEIAAQTCRNSVFSWVCVAAAGLYAHRNFHTAAINIRINSRFWSSQILLVSRILKCAAVRGDSKGYH